jgi:ribosome biogenesis GTPase
LHALGWSPTLERFYEACGESGAVPVRVVRAERTVWTVAGESGEFAATIASGRVNERPVVGDWCAATVSDRDGHGVIRAVVPRVTSLARSAAGRGSSPQVMAANVDVAFLVTGLDANYNLRRIERLLALTYDGGATPVVVLNKADLCDDVYSRSAEVERIARGTKVVALSAQSGDGLDGIRGLLEAGRTYVFLGSSGVGKSTIINRLLGREHMETSETRAKDGKGRHTTTHRELIVLRCGGVLIDSPGVREVGLNVSEEAIDATFDEIGRLANGCRFGDCTHTQEPGCAVIAAAESGELDPARLANYHRLRREAESAARRANEHERRSFEKRRFGSYRKWAEEWRKLKE